MNNDVRKDWLLYSSNVIFIIILVGDIINLISGAILFSIESNKCSTYDSYIIYTIVISTISMITCCSMSMYTLGRYVNYNIYSDIHYMIHVELPYVNIAVCIIFMLNMIYGFIAYNYLCSNKTYSEYVLCNIVFNCLVIMSYIAVFAECIARNGYNIKETVVGYAKLLLSSCKEEKKEDNQNVGLKYKNYEINKSYDIL